MIFFCDRTFGKNFARTLGFEWHDDHFPQDTQDDHWLSVIGERNWIALSQDYRLHRQQLRREAIRQHRVGLFYVWGAQAPAEESLAVFRQAFGRICDIAETVDRPFIYRVQKNARLMQVKLADQ